MHLQTNADAKHDDTLWLLAPLPALSLPLLVPRKLRRSQGMSKRTVTSNVQHPACLTHRRKEERECF